MPGGGSEKIKAGKEKRGRGEKALAAETAVRHQGFSS